MNSFILAINPDESARYHTDTHLLVGPRELCQMLCTAHPLPTDPAWKQMTVAERLAAGLLPYNRTKAQENNPIGIWVRKSDCNYIDMLIRAASLLKEYQRRQGQEHFCAPVLRGLMGRREQKLVTVGPRTAYPRMLPFRGRLKLQLPAYDTPDDDAVVANYRDYYRATKRGFMRRGTWVPAKWTLRGEPEWMGGEDR